MYIYTYIFLNTSKYFEMSLRALFSFQVTKSIDNIFCCLHLVVSVNIFSKNVPLKALAIPFPHPGHKKRI